MDALYSPLSRAERLIAAGRVVLSGASLVAVWLDPTEPARNANLVYGLMAAYVVHSIVVAIVVWRSRSPSGLQRLATQAIDLAVFSVFVYMTASVSSPFIAFFVFSMICGTMRWGWKGSLASAAVALGSFLGLGIYFYATQPAEEFQIGTFIIRGVYLAVVAVILGYMGRHEERVRMDLARLAAWPRPGTGATSSVVEDLLKYARDVIGSPRAIVVWEEREEPQRRLAAVDTNGFASDMMGPDELRPLVDPALDAAAFLCLDLGDDVPTVLRRAEHGLRTWRGSPVHEEFRLRFGSRAWLSAPLRGETISGRLFFLDKLDMTSDDLDLAEIVSEVVAARLDQHELVSSLATTAATEERIRVARDLHDGVLQSLTGIALRLAAASKRLEENPRTAHRDLEDIRRIIALEQRDLRLFIDDLKPPKLGPSVGGPALRERLRDLASRAEIEWNLKVTLTTEGIDDAMQEPYAREIFLLVREAVMNSLRHGGATEIGIAVRRSASGGVDVTVNDNGSGFPFEGVYTGRELAERGTGPKSLQERVAALQGTLRLESHPNGARLDLTLPAWRMGE